MELQTSGMTGGSEIITIADQRYVVRYQTPELALLGVDRAREAAVLNYLAAVDNKAMISPTMIEQHSQQLVVSYIWGKTAKMDEAFVKKGRGGTKTATTTNRFCSVG